jgi:hypothetical protein
MLIKTGVMSTMHFSGSPLTSGRVVLWRTFPILFISPLLSTFVNGYDLAIYLSVMTIFLLLLLVQYWVLCRQWSTWARLIPKMVESDVTEWYQRRLKGQKEKVIGLGPEEEGQEFKETAQLVFRAEVDDFNRHRIMAFSSHAPDRLVATAAKGLPLANWLVGKGSNGASLPAAFSNTWFVQLDLAMKSQQQLVRGLKEHSAFFLFRYAKYDVSAMYYLESSVHSYFFVYANVQ